MTEVLRCTSCACCQLSAFVPLSCPGLLECGGRGDNIRAWRWRRPYHRRGGRANNLHRMEGQEPGGSLPRSVAD